MSDGRPKDLPDFRKPPIVESLLGLQFEPIEGLTSAHLGLLWERFRDEFPSIQEQPPLRPAIEEFGPPKRPISVTIEEGLPTPRLWFLNDSGTRLIQVQTNRFIDNWRRLQKDQDENPYPRYEPRRARFLEEVRVLKEFLKCEGLGPIVVNQCEVTYVNHIEPSGVWENHGHIARVFNGCSFAHAEFLQAPEDAGFHARFLIPAEFGAPIGRLSVAVNPAWDRETKQPIFRTSLTARGAPLSEGDEGAFAFFDLGRRWIVKGFAELTTPEMHDVWQRCDEGGTEC